ncbi:MAG: hypothetical protein E7643_05035 [Ruminococcaceae bacterium]|nr:hypothetical protein [Oscillospiraceae bacterium]
MKKILCALLCAVMLLGTLVFVGCTGEPEEATLKFGMGVYTDVTAATSADEDVKGEGSAAITAAAVTVDADGKIVACVVDTAANTVTYTAEGKAIANDSFKTKGEMGKDYNMVAYGGAKKEWFEQADAFEAFVAGKTLSEVKALVAENKKGTDEVLSAGCTIMIHEFVYAIEKAYNNAVESDATAKHTLKLGTVTQQTNKDATEDVAGQSQLETTFFAAAVDADGKVVAATSDCVQIVFGFDAAGATTYDLTKKVLSKREKGENYGMKAYGGSEKEWFEQADAFCAACIGKTASRISALAAEDGYGTADIKSAGCTILVDGFAKAAAKIG